MHERTKPLIFEMDLPRRLVQRSFRRAVFETALRELGCAAIQRRGGGADGYEARRSAFLERAVHGLEEHDGACYVDLEVWWLCSGFGMEGRSEERQTWKCSSRLAGLTSET